MILPKFKLFEYDSLKLFGAVKCSKLVQEKFDRLRSDPEVMIGNIIRVTRRGYRPLSSGDLRVIIRFVRAGLGNEQCDSTDRLLVFFLMSCNFVSWRRHPRPSKDFPLYGRGGALWEMPLGEGWEHVTRERYVKKLLFWLCCL